MSKIPVVLVDDHALVRLGLKTLINDQVDMEVIGEAGTAQEAVQTVERLHPQVVLMDIRLPGEGGLDATRRIVDRFPDTKVVMLTSFADEELVMSAIRAGAAGYLLKEVGNEEVLRGIRSAAQGNSVMDAATTSRLFARVRTTERKQEQDAFRDLTDREMAVLYEVGQGKTNPEIAQSLNLSEKTARNYVSAILEKLQLSNRIELATYAVKYHLSERMKHE
jgi:two-component system, NarL family, response regulator DevR